ncbi:hypothetical protein ML462_14565 [Gramella lutea]|uniref:Uncharacterized protein n=1 Tax=Christiangramia lutea TaxID=1607951 RepID=A0A9X1V8K6_9FLAO|nr:hypothetical protein [Christiangramia lutea]MCH4824393.1 hypothetical protein [Christiangramia lutea]
MKTVKLYLVLIAVVGISFSSCNKDENDLSDNEIAENVAQLSLGPVLNGMINNSSTRQQLDDIPDCSDEAPAYAQISLIYGDANTAVDVVVEILSDENGLFTAYNEDLEITISPGSTTVSVTLNDFLIYSDDEGSPGEVIWVAPKSGSEFEIFVDEPLPNSWELRAGSKTYIEVPVICFDDRQVNMYGYQFFDIFPTEISTLCFFANYCTDSGRHYTANYSLDLYLGTSDAGEPLYLDQTPVVSNNGSYYADPVCLSVPSPPEGIGMDEPYLYYEITLTDWPGNYGSAEDNVESGTLSWNDVQALLNDDGTTTEYLHIFINCGKDDEEEGEDTYVVVTVDTENINEDNLNTTVFFTDSRSNSTSNVSSPENHIALVDKNRKIFWSGRTLENTGEIIEIVEIYRKEEGGEFILVRTYTDPEMEGFVIGDIRSDYVEGFEFYNLILTIYGETERTFVIDPKLQMNR